MAKRTSHRSFKRIFKDNVSYAQYSNVPFMEPLAHVAETYLYTEKAESDDDEIAYYSNFRLSSYIELYDFMSLAVYFIGAASTTHAQATIEGYIRNLNYRSGDFMAGMEIHYDDEGKALWITDSIRQFHIALLWITFVYSNARSMLDEESAPRWHEATKTLHRMLKEHIGITDDALHKKHHLYKQTGAAIKLMGKYMLEELKELSKKQEAEERNAEKDNSVASENVEQLNRTIEEQKAKIKELEELVTHYHQMEKGIALGLNQGQSALFVKSLANTFGFKYTNQKKELAPLAHKLFGWGEQKLGACMSSPCERKERDALAALFKGICPPLYATITNWGKTPPEVTPEVTPK